VCVFVLVVAKRTSYSSRPNGRGKEVRFDPLYFCARVCCAQVVAQVHERHGQRQPAGHGEAVHDLGGDAGRLLGPDL